MLNTEHTMKLWMINVSRRIEYLGDSIEKMINQRIGFSFPIHILLVGGVFIIAGLASLITTPFLGVGLIIAGIFVLSSSYGSQIDTESKKFREYGSMFGVKRGEWKPLEKMPYISVLKGRTGMRVYSSSNRSTSAINDRYEVYLLNESHRKKCLIQKFEDTKHARKFAEELASRINVSLVQYSPVVSQKSRSRR